MVSYLDLHIDYLAGPGVYLYVQDALLVSEEVPIQVGLDNGEILVFLNRQVQHGFQEIAQNTPVLAENLLEYEIIDRRERRLFHAGIPFCPEYNVWAGVFQASAIGLTRFINPWGLHKDGDNLFSETRYSGAGVMNEPGEGGTGKIMANFLEQSNVDVAEEIVSMILTQRGFQANSKTVTTTDTMLAEVIEMKR
jgi:hypothetical protein